MNSQQNAKAPGSVKKWLIAVRPFSFPASIVPVIFGAVLAATAGNASFNPFLFVLSLFAMMALHAGSNMFSDIHDFERGLDKAPTPVSGAIVRGLMTPAEVLRGAIALLLLGAVLGLLIAWLVGPVILALGLIGVVIGVSYTAKPFALKYHALGDLAVFLNFGILGALGSWTVQTGSVSWIPVIWAVPIGMLVIAILHANNWRDTASDREGKITTVASLLGDKGSLVYYGLLVFGAFAFVLVTTITTNLLATTARMPWTCLVVLVSLPVAVKLWKRALRRKTSSDPMDFVALDGATAQMNMVFGLLYTAGLILYAMINR